MLVIGLTGGIGSGKSTVSAMFEAKGAVVIDADRIVRSLQEPGEPVFVSMVDHFGPEIVAEDGTLDRQAVADRVFGDDDALKALNKIVHPAVGAEVLARMQAQAETDNIVILDIPLLVESGRDDMAATVVVDLDAEEQVARLVAHRGFDEADARARMARQASREDRLAKADRVIDNNGPLEALASQVDATWDWIISDLVDAQ